ncbi:MAG TPA: protein kinase [Planctomycetaceae bacterium]|nr:protein kinase [Planctomycetaceae bacterium]
MDRETLGPYQLLEEIGAGGMGTVYLAKHRETQDLAAIKVLPPQLAREEGFVMRFTREAEMLRTLTNPHVVRLLDSGVDDETYYFVMEYVDGETLAYRLRRDHRLPWKEAFEIAVQLCSALKAAHDAGIIHRDLKPSNVLLSKTGDVKLTDFGVAQLFASERLTITGGVIGTAEYMSPEQAQGQRATKRSDLYSLGVLLYAMLTGRPPFTGQTAMDVMHKQRFAQFDLPSSYVPDLPPTVDDAVKELLEKSPDKRPADAFVASRRLQDVLRRAGLGTVGDDTVAAPLAKPSVRNEGPGAGTFMRDLVRAEIVRSHAPTAWQQLFNNTVVLLVMLAGLGLFVWWMATPQQTPGWKLREAQRILNDPAGPEWLRARDELLLPLVQTDADRQQWGGQAQPLLDEIAIYDLEQRLLSPRRRDKSSAIPEEARRLLLESRQLWERGQLRLAQQQLTYLINLLEHHPDADAASQLARRWQSQIEEEQPRRDAARKEFVQAAVKHALERAPADPEGVRRMFAAVIALYSDEPLLADEVRLSKEGLRLDELEKQKSP